MTGYPLRFMLFKYGRHLRFTSGCDARRQAMRVQHAGWSAGCAWRPSLTGHAARASALNEMVNDSRSFRMQIGVIGTGFIGRTLTSKLSAAGHDVKVANSRGPETIDTGMLASGAHAVSAADAVQDVEVVILSIPLNRLPGIAPLIATVPAETIVIDTSNYYPARDSAIEAIDGGQVESQWVAEQLGRSIVKAWNAIGADSLARKGTPAGTGGRIAIPVAADEERERAVGMTLVEDTGFDGFDAGTLTQSWRQQPGAPSYCTDLTSEEMATALTAAEAARLPTRRDLAAAVIAERIDGDLRSTLEQAVRINRAVFI
ncbi:NADPH-dependent F420 reductase [Nocardia sp. CA-290969]|uniref:NADPH-dependent F420 reductase n=1 Tax=Nocardia sp. CA-290969 TaxID=3239986 RepID=UPI003D8B6F85